MRPHTSASPGDLARVQARASQEGMSPADVEKQVHGILGENPADLHEEAEQLARAHAVLHRALQDRN